jgi:acetyl-CoA/propionyl-CoA carboxylase biotin carboxyl carrier protein
VHGLAGPFTVHTRWVEDGFSARFDPAAEASDLPAAEPRQRVVVEVEGRRLELTLPAGLFSPAGPAPARPLPAACGPVLVSRHRKRGRPGPAAGSEALTAVMNGVVVKVAVEEGQEVAVDSPIAVIEAMKMEQPVRAHRAGTVAQLQVEVGSVVAPGTTICLIR